MTSSARTVGVVLLAAGSGVRLNQGPKALVSLAGRPLLSWALSAALDNACVREVVVVAPRDALALTERLVADQARPAGIPGGVRQGGATRQESAWIGVTALHPRTPYVAIAEAARPLTPAGTIDELLGRMLAAVPVPAGVVPVLPVFDTVRRVSGDRTCRETVDRDALRLTQTPQLFSRGCLHAAYRRAAATGTVFTDDAAAVADAGERVLAVPGSPRNFKITVDGDLALAQALVPEAGKHG